MRAENSDGFTPTCSVVICTRNRPLQLEQCLEAVARLVYPRFDVLVADNAPSDARTREVAARWDVRYIVEPVIGASRTRNRGARACETQIVAFLEDDALPEPAWLSGLAREFKDPVVMVVAGRVCPPGVDAEAERICALLGLTDVGGQQPWVIDRETPFWFEMANFGGIGIGSNMAFRRAAFDLWPGFDDRLGPGRLLSGHEEHHAFFTLLDRGYRFAYTPHAVVKHPFPSRSPQDLRRRYLRQLAASGGYIAFLLFEEPRYRCAILKFVAEGLRGTPRTWRRQVVGQSLRIAPLWRVMLAWLSGPLLYARTRLGHRLAEWP